MTGWLVVLAVCVVLFVVLVIWSCLTIARHADETAARMKRQWRERG